MAKIYVDQNLCIGCGFCSVCCPEIFELDEVTSKVKIRNGDNLVDSIEMELSPDKSQQVKEAVEGCPVKAIKLEE